MDRNSDGGSRGGGSSAEPVTQEMLAKEAAGGRYSELCKRVLQRCEEISKAGGHPEVEWLESLGEYRVRSGPDDEWQPFSY